MGMQKHSIFNLIIGILAEMCTFDSFRGKEDQVTHLSIKEKQITSLCPKSLKKFINCRELVILNTNLEAIPSGVEHLQNLETFRFQQNKGVGTSEDVAKLAGLKHLKCIHLSGNKIEELPDCFKSTIHTNSISGAEEVSFISLEEFFVDNNEIVNFPDTFFTLKALKRLNISRNHIKNMNSRISELCNLEFLDISGNTLQHIPSAICILNRLRYLDASYNEIENIPDMFFMLTSLHSLFLSNNHINTVSILGGNVENLLQLDISNNQLENVSFLSCMLLKLKYLNVSNNKLKILPEEQCFPINIVVLNLSKNALIDMPKLSYLKSLEQLDISNNRLKSLSYDLTLITSLTTLDASFNVLEELPDNIGNLNMLRTVTLDNNSLEALPSSYSALANIKDISLSNNRFAKIPYELLDCTTLTSINLNGNSIEDLFDTSFINTPACIESIARDVNDQTENTSNVKKTIFSLKNLENLYLDNNKLTEIPSEIAILSDLQTLTLSNNEIKTMPENIGNMQKLQVLKLDGNCLQCLPQSIKKLSHCMLSVLSIEHNFIPQNDCDQGFGLNSIIQLDLNHLTYHPQYPYFNVQKVIRHIQNDNMHWNINELKKIKLPIDLTECPTKISDKQVNKIWRDVLKYFIVYEEITEEQGSESSDVENAEFNTDIGEKTTIITTLDACKNIKANARKGVKHLVIDEDGNKYIPLYKKVSKLLRDNSTPKTENPIVKNKIEALLKDFIKAIFSKLLEDIIENKNDLKSLEILKISITELCENKLLSCIDNQLEGLQYYYSMFYSRNENESNNSIIDFISDIIASNKEKTFLHVINGEGKNDVHHTSRWSVFFKDVLGIQNVCDVPKFNIIPSGKYKYKARSILYDFLKKFTIDSVVFDILNKINANTSKLHESVSLLKHILREEQSDLDDYILYLEIIESYFEYSLSTKYSKVQPTKLKTNGLIKILLHLRILEENTKKAVF